MIELIELIDLIFGSLSEQNQAYQFNQSDHPAIPPEIAAVTAAC